MSGSFQTYCYCCGKDMVVTDCIILVCDECVQKGHTGLHCKVCRGEQKRKRKRKQQNAKTT